MMAERAGAGAGEKARGASRWLAFALIVSCSLSSCTLEGGDGASGSSSSGGTGTNLQVSPSTELSSFGIVGGPFSPASLDYTLTNSGTSTINWSASANQNWISLSSQGGQLDAGIQTTLTVSIDQTVAAALTLGTFVGNVTIEDLTNGETIGRTVTLNVSSSGGSSMSASLSQFGITWDFDKAYEVGQFANGDWWVLGPVTIVKITPVSVEVGTRTMNGSMLNPMPPDMTQGYDSDTYGQYRSPGDYDPLLNVALGVSTAKPLVLQPHSSLVSTISEPVSGARPQLQTAAILTVLPVAPPPGSFRPAYCGSDKTILFNTAQLDRSLLAKLAPLGLVPEWSEVERYLERPWIDHVSIWAGNYIHPSKNMPDYGRDMCDRVSVAALMLHLDAPDSEKETTLIRLVQLGIDLWGISKNGGYWACAAGHMSGRKWPILFAGLMLADPDMSNIGFNPEAQFGEDGQTFYVEETPPGSGIYNLGYGGYGSQHLGMAEWGTAHARQIWWDDSDWFGDAYRLCCTANVWWGQLLAAYVMGAKPLWNHDELFDYQDRYLDVNRQLNVLDWRLAWRDFYLDMWDAYRPNY